MLGFNAAGYAREAAELTDEVLVADAMDVLRKLYGPNIPEPTEAQRSNWSKDPFALCAYSFNAIGADINTRRTLARPVASQLYFAGEATALEYPFTVHGAYLSGQRAAAEIMGL